MTLSLLLFGDSLPFIIHVMPSVLSPLGYCSDDSFENLFTYGGSKALYTY